MASPAAPTSGSSPAPPPAVGGLAAAGPSAAAPSSAVPSTAPSPRPPTILRPQPPPSINPHAHAHSQYQQPGQFYPPPVKNTKENPAMAFAAQADSYNRLLQGWLDWSTPYPLYRWAATGGLLFLFALRVVYGEGWYIVAYGLSIFLLNIFLAFLQPRFDPSLEADQVADEVEGGGDAGTGGGSGFGGLGLGKKLLRAVGVETSGGQDSGILGESNEDEFKPFIRRLPEFKFWLQATRATLISLFLSLTRASDIPVYWPILLIYFITLFGLTMRRQIAHMVKYKYIPFDLGRKAKYGSKK